MSYEIPRRVWVRWWQSGRWSQWHALGPETPLRTVCRLAQPKLHEMGIMNPDWEKATDHYRVCVCELCKKRLGLGRKQP